MPKNNPIEKLLTEMTNMLEMIQDNKEKVRISETPLPEGVEKQIDELEKMVQDFEKFQKDLLIAEGISQDTFEEFKKNLGELLPKKDARLFAQSQKLKKEFQTLQSQMKIGKTLTLMRKKKAGSFGKARQKKFRRIGNRKDWKPL